MDNQRTWEVVDHICRICSGRILKCATNQGMSPGGNPLWRCADCGHSTWGIGVDCICWCGFTMRSQDHQVYMCLPLSLGHGDKDIARLFGECGFDVQNPSRRSGEVGVVLLERYRELMQRKENEKDTTPPTEQERLLIWRGVDPGKECTVCKGSGILRGADGTGKLLSPRPCYSCWGSGNAEDPWPSHQEVKQQTKHKNKR